MAGTASTHNLRNVSCLVGSVALGGFKEDAAITFEPLSPISQSEVGSDGEVVVNYINDDRVRVRVSCQENGVVNRNLMTVYDTHRAALDAGLVIPDTKFLMIDPSNGDRVQDAQLHFEDVPLPSKSKVDLAREWVFLLPNGRRGARLAAAIGV